MSKQRPKPDAKTQTGRNIPLPATRDTFVHYLFGTVGNEAVLLAFINSVLENAKRPLVKKVETLNPFNPKKFITDKYTILDVKATDTSGKVFAIEFQACEHASFAERLLYYWARTYTRHLKEGDEYKALPQVISIAVVGFELFDALPGLFNSFYIMAEADPRYVLTEDLQIHTVEATEEKIGQLPELKPAMRRWLSFFYYADKKSEAEMKVLLKGDHAVERAYEEYRKFCNDEELRAIDDARQQYLHDYNSDVGAAFEKGELKGKADTILAILKGRFKRVPKQIVNSLNERLDSTAMDSLAVLAATCESLDVFAEALK